MTAQDLINLAAKDIGVIASGETLNTEENTDCLAKLNQLIALWDTEYLNIFATQRNAYTLTANRITPYSIGPTGSDFTSNRPISIRSANVVTSAGGYEFGLRIGTVEDWNMVVEKAAIGDPPELIYYDNDYPNGLVYLDPWPASASTLVLYTWEQLTQMASLGATFDFPPGYAEALEWNLAISLAPMFGRPLTPDVVSKAASAKGSIRANNAPPNPGRAEQVQASGAATPVPPDAGNAMNR